MRVRFIRHVILEVRFVGEGVNIHRDLRVPCSSSFDFPLIDSVLAPP